MHLKQQLHSKQNRNVLLQKKLQKKNLIKLRCEIKEMQIENNMKIDTTTTKLDREKH